MKQTVKVQEVIIIYTDIVKGEIAPPRKQVVNVAIMPDDYHFTDSFYRVISIKIFTTTLMNQNGKRLKTKSIQGTNL